MERAGATRPVGNMNKDLKAALAAADAQHTLAECEYKQAQRMDADIVKKFCTVKVGDTIVARGWSYNGKNMRVTEIIFNRSYGKPHFHCAGRVLTKDGRITDKRSEARFTLDMKPIGRGEV